MTHVGVFSTVCIITELVTMATLYTKGLRSVQFSYKYFVRKMIQEGNERFMWIRLLRSDSITPPDITHITAY